MTTQTEALKLALEAGFTYNDKICLYQASETQLKIFLAIAHAKALAQPEPLEGLKLIHQADIDLAKKRALEAQQSNEQVEPCPDKERNEYVCKNRNQCWEPCGELGKSEEHVKVYEQVEPVAWQERQAKRMSDGVVTEWTNWYPCRYRTIDEARAEACDHIPYEWRPLYTHPPVPDVVEPRTAQPKEQKQRPFTKKQRDTLCTVYAIASASTTANSLPNIAKIVNELLTEDLEVQPKAPEQEPVARVVKQGATVKLEWVNADSAHNAKVGNLYTTTPHRKPLTEEQNSCGANRCKSHGCYGLCKAHDFELQMMKLCPYFGKSPARDVWIEGYKAAHGIKE